MEAIESLFFIGVVTQRSNEYKFAGARDSSAEFFVDAFLWWPIEKTIQRLMQRQS
jgi:hypothetical protein